MQDIHPCPSCGRRLRLHDAVRGKLVQCPACHSQFRADLPEPDEPPTVVTPEPEPEAAANSPEPKPEETPAEHGIATPTHRRRAQAERPRAGRAARRPAPKGGRWAAAVGVLVGVFGLIGLYVLILIWQFGPPAANKRGVPQGVAGVAVREDPEQRRQEIVQAFQNQKPLTEKEIAGELKPLFQGLRDAKQAQDQERMLAFFNLDLLLEELLASDFLPAGARQRRGEFMAGVRQGMGRSLVQNVAFDWKDFDIKNVRKLQGNEAVVIVRHRTADGASMKMRWWVTKRQGAWQVFDLEDLDMGIRVSTTAGAVAAMGVNNPDVRRIVHLGHAIQAAVKQDTDGAEKHLKQIAQVKLPDQLEAVRHVAGAFIHFQRAQFEEAMKALERADGCNPNMPGVDMFKGLCYNRLGKWDKALAHIEKYRGLLGEDAEVCRELGEALRGLSRFPEAAVAYRKALDEEPKDIDAFLGLLRALGPGEKADDVGQRFLKLGATREQFDECAEDCRQGNDWPMLERLALAMRQVDPQYPPVTYSLALTKARAGKTAEALPLFRDALAKQPDAGKRHEYGEEFALAMTSAGKAVEAYAALPAPREAFRSLAAGLKKGFRTDDLHRLVSAHAKKDPGDPLLHFYRGELFVQEGKFEPAEKAFAAGMANPPDPTTPDQFRGSRVTARYHTAGALSAYKEIGPRHETFSQLVSLCFQKKDFPQLKALLDAHEKDFPDNAEVLRHRCRLAMQHDRTEEGLALFKKALAKQTQQQERKRLVSDFLLDAVDAGKPLAGYRAAPDAAEAFRILADDLLEQGRREELKSLLEEHRRKHPGDVWLTFYEGENYLDEQAWDKAARTLGEAWKKGPADLLGRARSGYVLASYRAGRGLQAYQEIGLKKEVFTQLANLMAGDRRGKSLEALVAAHRPHAGDDPEPLFFEARAKVFRSRPAEAAPLLRAACQKQNVEHRRKYYVNQYVTDMENSGWGLQAYRDAPDKAAAFETLARTLAAQKKAAELEDLLREHAKADAWQHFYAGELLLLRGEAKKAEKEFAVALAGVPPANDWTFRRGLYRARVKAREAVRTYREFGPGPRAFEDLAQVCLADKDAGQLEALIAEHRRVDAEDPNLVAWGADVKWLRQDYSGTLALLDERRDDVFAMPRFRWKAENYRVRGLVKLGRTDEALKEAEAQVKNQQGNRTLLVLANAARGDAKGAVAALGKQPPGSFLVGECYRDPDLGPILRSEPFGEFRERFPEPKGRHRNIPS